MANHPTPEPATEPTVARTAFGDVAPALAAYTDKILFGEVWERPGLTPRDRSLITVASLVALYRGNELPFHIGKALDNGVSRDELIELITQLAFYSRLAHRQHGAGGCAPGFREPRRVIGRIGF